MVAGCDEFKTLLDDHYEKSANGRVPSDELVKVLNLGARDLANRMDAWGFGKPKTMRVPDRSGTVNGYHGLRRKRHREDEEEEERDGDLGGGGTVAAV
jgi:hypothetical protein